MRSDKKNRHSKLVSLIMNYLKSDYTLSFEGHDWVNLPQTVWCKLLGVTRPLSGVEKEQLPIVPTKALLAGSPAVLTRLREEPHGSPRALAKAMARRNSGCKGPPA